MTVIAIANLIAVLVDTMRRTDMPNDIIHGFLDGLDRLNGTTLYGAAGAMLDEVVDIVRVTVPVND
ncbi:hypothetical protein [Sphingomonas prati]|uniref:Uncharacterized protein n=1 Tax=Sphingomonas prati TaxID=1843237 RepID=A0A7W9BQH5_9SPHN|nr:hypothetical protein [Sphingomonas prati]MBB5728287.1 hypothetical protein [Sphingomonas prati]